MKKMLAMLFFISAALCLLAGCGGKTDAPQSDNSLQKVLDTKQFVLGLDVGFPPMGFADETGEITGFDIDVAQEVCNRLGVSLVKKGIDWNTKEDKLSDGTIDCIWNGLSVTPERSRTMNFSEPYMKNELIFVVSADSGAKGMYDLAGKKVGVQSGATAADALKASDIASKVSVASFEDNLTLLRQLEQGVVDAALIDSVVAYYYIFSSDKQFFILPSSLGEEKYAIGFRKGDQKLRDRVQSIISDMKADGTLGKISKKWFGSDITIVK
ncbi:MAG: amino acid ABC transporter substrate-binding protein [Schwartzia sp.]|nr:amino acid ABC transporter substrate-binding protein [Schwartzia sp. (in: firmicutes)]